MQRSEIWFDREGKAIPIVSMDDDYVRNAYKFVVRSICKKAGELEASRFAPEDDRIDDAEQAAFEKTIAKDLLGLEKDLDNIRRAMKKRGLPCE